MTLTVSIIYHRGEKTQQAVCMGLSKAGHESRSCTSSLNIKCSNTDRILTNKKKIITYLPLLFSHLNERILKEPLVVDIGPMISERVLIS